MDSGGHFAANGKARTCFVEDVRAWRPRGRARRRCLPGRSRPTFCSHGVDGKLLASVSFEEVMRERDIFREGMTASDSS